MSTPSSPVHRKSSLSQEIKADVGAAGDASGSAAEASSSSPTVRPAAVPPSLLPPSLLPPATLQLEYDSS